MAIDYYPGGLRIGHINENVEGPRSSDAFAIEAKFIVLVVLNGRQVFTVNDRAYELEANEKSGKASAVTIAVQSSAVVHYLESSGHPLRKLAIAGDLDWFNQFQIEEDASETKVQLVDDRMNSSFKNDGVSAAIWNPSTRVARLATQIILPPPEDNTQQLGLYRMSKGIEILRCMSEERAELSPDKSERVEGRRKAEDIRLYILDNLNHDLTTNQLENRFCRNRRSLQRLFKSEYGVGISEFVRGERLKRANTALRHDGISIAEAAFLAGYSNTANFSTAFRREFGMPPAQAKSCEV
ncbi:helix-turn-helix transcriptional regulator [Rhodobacteraceae bacterium B1Z28]|uniref:Helix-turn-helix transcriptional regulator n=1 Tax=Ruegeria haliotis TaxID=2747601 RepID=A0ABX2PT34_9RHOB|nr:AraC family transcriptional regulator [Ruegeria haliotis]NVO57345.1 helix-turn-helix transcriptional regulator [Ruegeria haliotis]